MLKSLLIDRKYTIHAGSFRCHPLRIQYSQEAYAVINDTTVHSESLPRFDHLVHTCTYLHRRLECNVESDRHTFQQIAANVLYYRLMLQESIEILERDGGRILAGERDRERRTRILSDLESKVPEWDYQNTCFNVLYETSSKFECATSSFFVALPSDLESWDDLDTSTHQFRLYFLCDNWMRDCALEELPQHVHLSNHPGYSLHRPQDFFRTYGDYVLRMLRMIQHGYSDNTYEIPPLDASKILWNCNPEIIGSHLTKDTIRAHVSKAVAYLQGLPLSKWKKLGLTRKQSAAIKMHLDIQDGDSTTGNLRRFVDSDLYVSWMCQAHTRQYIEQEPLTILEEFVCGQGGWVDVQRAAISITLRSSVIADQFLIFLTGTSYIFDISIKLDWWVTRSYVKEFCLDIAEAGTLVLEIDGITLDIHPQDNMQHTYNLFIDEIIYETELQFVTLLNYPQPQEQCIHFSHFSLHSKHSPARHTYSWVEVRAELEKFHGLVSAAQTPSDCNIATRGLQKALETHGFSEVTTVTLHRGSWEAVFDLQKDSVVEAHSQHTGRPKTVFPLGYLRTLTVFLFNQEFDQEFFHMMRTSAGLRHLIFSHNEHNEPYYTENIVRMWLESSSPFRLTLLERVPDGQCRVVAHMAISQGESDHHPRNSGDRFLECNTHSSLCQQMVSITPVNIQFLQWDRDQGFSQSSDFSASFLDMAILQHPSILTLFTLDASQLSRCGLASVQSVLCHSSLECLNVVCKSFDSSVSDSIAEVLASVQWSTIKSLILSGEYINKWLELWPAAVDTPMLLCLVIRGTGSVQQELSHSSILVVHSLVSSSLVVEFRLHNVVLQDKNDWALVRNSVGSAAVKHWI